MIATLMCVMKGRMIESAKAWLGYRSFFLCVSVSRSGVMRLKESKVSRCVFFSSTSITAMSTAASSGSPRVGTKYRTYKRATDKLASCLATTADGLGIKYYYEKSNESGSHVLNISQFTYLADSIIEAIPKVEVPLEVVDIAQKVYKFRQERATLLK